MAGRPKPHFELEFGRFGLCWWFRTGFSLQDPGLSHLSRLREENHHLKSLAVRSWLPLQPEGCVLAGHL